jgi:hypothetical protein
MIKCGYSAVEQIYTGRVYSVWETYRLVDSTSIEVLHGAFCCTGIVVFNKSVVESLILGRMISQCKNASVCSGSKLQGVFACAKGKRKTNSLRKQVPPVTFVQIGAHRLTGDGRLLLGYGR